MEQELSEGFARKEREERRYENGIVRSMESRRPETHLRIVALLPFIDA